MAGVNAINHGMSEAVNKKTYSKHQKKHQVLKKSDLLVAVLKHMKGIKIKKKFWCSTFKWFTRASFVLLTCFFSYTLKRDVRAMAVFSAPTAVSRRDGVGGSTLRLGSVA